jgi:hypothetical protein
MLVFTCCQASEVLQCVNCGRAQETECVPVTLRKHSIR